MDFLIQNAWAEGAAAAPTPSIVDFLPLVFIFVVFYFLLIRPQSKRMKEHKALVENLSKGDEVVTNGGLLGKVMEVGDNFLLLEVADGVQFRVQKQAVSTVMPKGTMKEL